MTDKSLLRQVLESCPAILLEMLLGRSFLSLEEGSSFKAGENAVILQNPHPAWKPAPSAASNWIGITSNGTDNVPGGDYQYQTTFSMPLNCKTLDVSFAVDDAVKSVAVSDGTKTLKQTITSFSGGGNGCGVRRIGNFQSFDGLACYYHTDLPCQSLWRNGAPFWSLCIHSSCSSELAVR